LSAGRCGDYRFDRYLAAGGMADLYLAHHPSYGARPLVVKRIQPRYLEHERVVRMFLDEGRIAQALDHPNIVRVVDVGQCDGNYYIAMEYIPGHDLVAVTRRAAEAGLPVPRSVALGIVEQVAAGLDYAHARTDADGRPLRIVHCDVSPGNVVVATSGVAKIVDFGIARATIALREEQGTAGKYGYMAPEQIKGEPVDARADLFSLGVILWELCVGARLFRGRPEVVMREVIEAPIARPSERVPGFPATVEALLFALLERDRERRLGSAARLVRELRAERDRGEEVADREAIARWLAGLWRAPRRASGEDELPGEEVVEHGMPESPDGSEEAATAAIALPERRARTQARGEETRRVSAPPLGRRSIYLSSGVVVGGCLMLLALALLIAFFALR
jgi:serine/threonine-protein kinase